MSSTVQLGTLLRKGTNRGCFHSKRVLFGLQMGGGLQRTQWAYIVTLAIYNRSRMQGASTINPSLSTTLTIMTQIHYTLCSHFHHQGKSPTESLQRFLVNYTRQRLKHLVWTPERSSSSSHTKWKKITMWIRIYPIDIINTNLALRNYSRAIYWWHTTNHSMTQSIQQRQRPPDRPLGYQTIQQELNQNRLSGIRLFSNCGIGPTCQHELVWAFNRKHTPSPTLPHPFICNPLPNSHEQGRTLELEREWTGEGNGGEKEEEEEKHQHSPMDLINILNPIMVSSRD
jgi:hypothetical protein